jgi:hypothetical protein
MGGRVPLQNQNYATPASHGVELASPPPWIQDLNGKTYMARMCMGGEGMAPLE